MESRLGPVIECFEDLDRVLRGLVTLLKVFLAMSMVGFIGLAITFGAVNMLASGIHAFFLPAAFIGELIGVLLSCFFCYNQISSIQEKVTSLLDVLQTEERHAQETTLKQAIYEAVHEAYNEVFSSAIMAVRVLFFAPGTFMTIVGIVLILVATVDTKLRIITFTTGSLFVGLGICGMIFILIAYKHVTQRIEQIRMALDDCLSYLV